MLRLASHVAHVIACEMSSAEQSSESEGEADGATPAFTEIDRDLLNRYVDGWRNKGHKHLTFRRKEFKLVNIGGLVAQPIDLTRLESLDLSDNELTTLDPIVNTHKERVPALRVLKARSNQIRIFEAVLPSLRELDLGYNQLSALPPLSGVPRLELLVLSHNKITGSWEGLKWLDSTLKVLDISDNMYAFMPSELTGQLLILKNLRCLHTLRLKGNEFTYKLPEYQVVVLQCVSQLVKLDDMDPEAMKDAKRLADSMGRVEDMNKLNKLVAERRNVRVQGSRRGAGTAEHLLPTLDELSKPLSEALEDPDNVPKAIKQLVRLSDILSSAHASRTQEIFRHLMGDKDKDTNNPDIKAALDEFLGNFNVVLGRVEGNQAGRAMLIRSLAKLGKVEDDFGMGTSCINCLGWLLKRSASDEAEILSTVREIIIDPLKYKKSSDQPVKQIIAGLATFNSPAFPKYLSGLIEWLTKSYCDSGKQADPEITRLMAIATSDPKNTEAALNHGSSNADIGVDVGSSAAMLLPKKVMDVVTQNQGLQSNPAQRGTYMYLLQIIKHMAHTVDQSVSKVVEYYETKKFHGELMGHLIKMFSEGSSGQAKPNDVDLAKMKLPNIRTCACLIDALVALMSQSKHGILNQLVDGDWDESHQRTDSIVDYLLIAPKATPVADPELMAASLSGLRLVLESYGQEKVHSKHEIMDKIIGGLNKMEDLLKFIDSSSRKYNDLWFAAEKNLAEGDGPGKKMPDSVSAPKFPYLFNPLVCRCFVSIVSLIEFFTMQGKEGDKMCADVSEKLDEKDREKLLFALLAVPNRELKREVIRCISEVDVGHMQSGDVGDLVNIVAGSKDIAVEEELLEKVIDQLRILMSSENKAKGGGIALRSEHAEKSIVSVLGILRLNAQRRTYTDWEAEGRKTCLSLSCVKYLQVVSMNPDLRKQYMRTRTMTMAMVQVLKLEDELHSPHNPDIIVEKTWAGRSVETLLQSLSGVAQLRAQQKVAYRIISRLADVLEGRPDQMRKKDDRIMELMAENERAMWEERLIKRILGPLSDEEREDRDMQHEMFVSNSGMDRLVLFLTGEGTKDATYERRGLFADEKTRAMFRVTETASVQDSQTFVKSAITNAETKVEEERAAIMHDPTDLQAHARREMSDSDSDLSVEDAVAMEFPGQGETGNFQPGKPLVDLKKYNFNPMVPGSFCLTMTFVMELHVENATLLDWGNGPLMDNIICGINGSTYDLVFEYYEGKKLTHKVIVPDVFLTPGEMIKILISVNDAGHVKVWCNGDMKKESMRGLPLHTAKRKALLLGSSLSHERNPFQGRIQDLKFWPSCNFTWDEILDDASSSAESEPDGNDAHPDRKVLMNMFMEAPSDDGPPKKPEVKGSASLSVNTEMDLTINEAPFREFSDGTFNPAYPVAASLRCCFALLKYPAADSVKKAMIGTLADKLMVCRLLSLVGLCGPFDCFVAAKLLKVMNLALECNPTMVRADKGKIVVFDMLLAYCIKLCKTATAALRQKENQLIAERGRALSLEITCLAATICQTVPMCQFSDDVRLQQVFIESCLSRLVPISLVQFILNIVVYEPQNSSEGSTFISERAVKDSQGMSSLYEWATQVLAQLLDHCPSMKYSVLELFGNTMVSGSMPLRQSFVTGILARTTRSKEKVSVEAALNNMDTNTSRPSAVLLGDADDLKSSEPERTLSCANVDVFICEGDGRSGGYYYYPTDTSKPGACFNLVLTNICLYLVDTTAKGYPDRPTMKDSRRYCDMTRVVKGHLAQVLILGFAVRGRPTSTLCEEFMIIICHRETDRNDLVSALIQLSQPEGGTFADRVPLQQDKFLKHALLNHVTELIIRCSLLLRGVGGPLRLFVLSEGNIYEFEVRFENWVPTPTEDDDDDVEDDGDEDLLIGPSSRLPEMPPDSKKGKPRKLTEYTAFHQLTAIEDAAGLAKERSTAEDISKGREDARNNRRNVLATSSIERAREMLLVACNEPPLPQAWPLNSLERVAFFPDGMPKMALTFKTDRGNVDVPMLFLDDTTREQWRRGLMAQLSKNQASDSWVRSYESTRGRS